MSADFTLTQDDVKAIAEAMCFDDRDYDEDSDHQSIRTDYEGRGMYGQTCLALVGTEVTLFAFEVAALLASRDDEERGAAADIYDVRTMLDDIGAPRTDSMGRQTVYYFTNVDVESES